MDDEGGLASFTITSTNKSTSTKEISEGVEVGKDYVKINEDSPIRREYRRAADGYTKVMILVWCLAGWSYAFFTWHLFFLPAILVILPGIFVPVIITGMVFAPYWVMKQRVLQEWTRTGRRNWLSVGKALAINWIGIFLSGYAAIGYVRLLRHFFK